MKPLLEVIDNSQASSSLQCFDVNLTKKTPHWHYHPEVELTLVTEGEGVRLVGDHVGHFATGDLMLTGENLPHDFNVDANDSNAQFVVIQFKPELVSSFPELSNITEFFNRAKRGVLFKKYSPQVEKTLHDFLNLAPANRLIQLFDVLHQLSSQDSYEQLCSSRFNQNPLGDLHLSRLNNVINFVQENYARPVDLKEVATLSCMTEPSFCRWFRHAMDCSFVQYLHRCRVEHAARILVMEDKKVAMIATDCGFESLSSFNRAFKKVKQQSPLQYRKQWRY